VPSLGFALVVYVTGLLALSHSCVSKRRGSVEIGEYYCELGSGGQFLLQRFDNGSFRLQVCLVIGLRKPRSSIFLLVNLNRLPIVPLAARRKGIARFAVLHLDCARSAWGGAYRFTLENQRSLCLSGI